MKKTNPPFMSGVPELLILRLLCRQEMYGYELVRAIRVVSREAFDLAEGVVYPVLHTLEKKQFLKAKRRVIEGRNRVYYAVTVKGRQRMAELIDEWTRIKGGIDSALGEQHG